MLRLGVLEGNTIVILNIVMQLFFKYIAICNFLLCFCILPLSLVKDRRMATDNRGSESGSNTLQVIQTELN